MVLVNVKRQAPPRAVDALPKLNMSGTPKRKSIAAATHSPAQSLVGRSVVIPTEIFPEDNVQYTGQVTGTPTRRKNAVYVKVDQDASQYWFPANEVSKWVVDQEPATTAATATPKRAKHKHKQQHVAQSSKQTTPESQMADADHFQHEPVAVAPIRHPAGNSPAAAGQLNDASSCHPPPQEDFTDALEGLVSTVVVRINT